MDDKEILDVSYIQPKKNSIVFRDRDEFKSRLEFIRYLIEKCEEVLEIYFPDEKIIKEEK